VPSLAEYYGRGLDVHAEPGTRFAYTDHGFATLGRGRIQSRASTWTNPRLWAEGALPAVGALSVLGRRALAQ
jgi:hypothetical protein